MVLGMFEYKQLRLSLKDINKRNPRSFIYIHVSSSSELSSS